MRSPAGLNTSTDGAGRQHFERGGLSAAPFSSSVRERGRWNTQILSCASIVMPPTWPRIQLFGNGFGQYGSTRNAGLWAWAEGRPNNSTAQVKIGHVHECLLVTLVSSPLRHSGAPLSHLSPHTGRGRLMN